MEPDRTDVHDMTERELLEECVTAIRALNDLAASFVKSVESNPLFSKMGSMLGKFGR